MHVHYTLIDPIQLGIVGVAIFMGTGSKLTADQYCQAGNQGQRTSCLMFCAIQCLSLKVCKLMCV